jgi:hypothetical protein
MAATLDGRIEGSETVFDAKFMLPGHSRKRRRPRSTCHSCSTICGWSRRGRRSFR